MRLLRLTSPAVRQKSNVKIHIRVDHLGLKPFVCTVDGCHETFAYKHKMVRHTRSHREPDNSVQQARPFSLCVLLSAHTTCLQFMIVFIDDATEKEAEELH